MKSFPELRAQARRIEKYLIEQTLIARTPDRAQSLVDALLLIDCETPNQAEQSAHYSARKGFRAA